MLLPRRALNVNIHFVMISHTLLWRGLVCKWLPVATRFPLAQWTALRALNALQLHFDRHDSLMPWSSSRHTMWTWMRWMRCVPPAV